MILFNNAAMGASVELLPLPQTQILRSLRFFVDPVGTSEESISWDGWIMRGKRQIPLRCVICMMPYCAIWIYMI